MLYSFDIPTKEEHFYDVTPLVLEAVNEYDKLHPRLSGEYFDGLAVIYCPHTTAGITVNENADPDVVKDMLLGLSEAFPNRPQFKHAEGNSSAHLKASAIGSSVTLIIEKGRLLLGTWQGIYFCEFDPPRQRKFFVKIIES